MPVPDDVREDVERAVRHRGSVTPGIAFRPVDDQVAARAELLDHRVDRVLRPVQRLDRGDLLRSALVHETLLMISWLNGVDQRLAAGSRSPCRQPVIA